ncbi:MAG: hypothetical protein ABI873_19490 [Marmoricola sp.]
MSKKRGNDRRGRQAPRRQHLRSVPTQEDESAGDGAEDQALFQSLRRALRSDEPVDLLEAVSSLLSVTDPRASNPFSDDGPRVGLDELVDSFVGTDYAETTAALTVIRALVADELQASRIGKVLATRRQPMPAWLVGLEGVVVPRVVELTHVLGDGDDYLLDARLPTGEAFTALVYVDHNLGTVVKDAFVIAKGLAEVLPRMEQAATDPDQVFADVDPARARAVVTEAIQHGALTYPPLESDTWPACRPLVEWLVRALPAGATVPARPEPSEEELARLRAGFFASSHGRDLDHEDQHGLLESLTWFGTEWGPGDPMRWSPVNVEMLLVDWIPRKIVADPAYLAKVPDLLRAFIGYCHESRAIRHALTLDTLAAVDHWEPEYQRLIRSDRPQGPDALLAGLLEVGYDDSTEALMLESLARVVGGRVALLNLDVEPLPDEPFEWGGVPGDIHDRVREVLDLCDRCAVELLDVEHRTAMRRFLGLAAVGDPAIFRRKSSPARAAAAVAWVVAGANETIGHSTAPMEVRELLAWFGVTGSVSQRAEVFMEAAGVGYLHGGTGLGQADLLVARRRRQVVEQRERYLAGS